MLQPIQILCAGSWLVMLKFRHRDSNKTRVMAECPDQLDYSGACLVMALLRFASLRLAVEIDVGLRLRLLPFFPYRSPASTPSLSHPNPQISPQATPDITESPPRSRPKAKQSHPRQLHRRKKALKSHSRFRRLKKDPLTVILCRMHWISSDLRS